ncbi:macrolide family glycosyltransferase [Melittangium boletus]|uniref:macrolide family glycosyltransferase n=1 Tax=Melittangium boletus TaxID=83453 RepID=UPI003DA41E05
MKVLFFPLLSPGHVNPMLPLARELVSRGHDVVFFVNEAFEQVARATGATTHRLGNGLALPSPIQVAHGGLPRVKDLMAPLFEQMRQALHELPRMVDAARALGAEAVVYDPIAQWGASVARALGVPAVQFEMAFARGAPSLTREMKADMGGPPPLAALGALVRFKWESWKLQRERAVPAMNVPGGFEAFADLNLLSIPRGHQPDAERFDERFVFVGPSVAPRGDRGDFPLEWLEGHPVLLISLGTSSMNQQPGFFAACVEAFRDSPWRVVMACGAGVDPGALAAPSNFLVRRYVPQLEVLPRARVFITHGGTNSVLESLWFGVPMAVHPTVGGGWIDQPLNARLVTRHGLGLTLTSTEPRALREAVERLDTEPGYRERIAAYQPTLREGGGAPRAAEALLAFLASRRQAASRSVEARSV